MNRENIQIVGKIKGKISSSSTSFWKRGDYMVWLTGGALAVCVFMIVWVVGVIVMNGMTYFWPREVTLYEMKDGKKYLAILRQTEKIPMALAKEQNLTQNPHRRMLMVGNRDWYGQDFIWVNDQDVVFLGKPGDVWVMDRREYGRFIGYVQSLNVDGQRYQGREMENRFQSALKKGNVIFERIYRLERYEIGKVNRSLERVRLEGIRAERTLAPEQRVSRQKNLDAEQEKLQQKYQALLKQVAQLRSEGAGATVELCDMDGKVKMFPVTAIVHAWQPNRMGILDRMGFYAREFYCFLMDDPREANTEGGIFPAMFGTAFMVVLMSLAVVPFGVLTAFYLCEYASQGPMVRAVRIALNNLAGVPSIVYGVFGLGFFVYFLGGTIDRLFYSEALPNPTWGTGGILWASLTLALLTVPVVVMATEESISAVPRGMREGSLALGASKFQTLVRILLPASLPGILTGVILAMARGAGEVAPLMITGVVKLAPTLAVDKIYPFVHLERKFMHLGFHIFDTGFQSPNVEASRPMVFATAFLLILLVIALNLGAILLRDHVRKRYTTGAFN